MAFDNGENDGRILTTRYSSEVIRDAELCLLVARIKLMSPGFLRKVIFDGFKGYGHAITIIPADAETLSGPYYVPPNIDDTTT